MTIEVEIKHKNVGYDRRLLVEEIGHDTRVVPPTMRVNRALVVDGGESITVYAHDTQSIRITEIPAAAETSGGGVAPPKEAA